MENQEERIYREVKIQELLDEECKDGELGKSQARENAIRLLMGEKGFSSGDLAFDVPFEIKNELHAERIIAEIIVSVDGQEAVYLMCVAGSIASRERHVVAGARLMRHTPLPLAVVIDPLGLSVLETAKGEVIGEGYAAFPTKAELRILLDNSKREPLPARRREMETRILLAYDSVKCRVIKDTDGGVDIG